MRALSLTKLGSAHEYFTNPGGCVLVHNVWSTQV